MDPITTATVTAIAAGAAAGATKVCEQTIVDAYGKLKSLIKRKFGPKSEVVKAVNSLEGKPDSVARKEVVAEEISSAKADQDPELLRAAEALLKIIKASSNGTQLVQSVIGNQNIQIAGDGNTAKLNKP